MKTANILIGLMFFVLSVIVVDCASGKWVYYHGEITNHRYVAAYTTHGVDSEGNSTTDYHPEEFHLGFSSDESVTLDINTSQNVYNAHTDGQMVWVKARKGKLGIYLARISNAPSAENQKPP